MDDLRERLLATSIRMYSLHQTALSLCSVKTLSELTAELLPYCITAMDVATACLLCRDGTIHSWGIELGDLDIEYLREKSWRVSNQCAHDTLPSGAPFLASPIQKDAQTLGMLIVVDKEVSDFEKRDFQRIQDLATITTTALENVYEYENLRQQKESLEEDREKQEELELQQLRQEFEDARVVQLSLLPRHPPSIAGFEIEGVCLPAREVGGDFYDYVSLGSDILAIVLADVAGKGMKGAMYAALSYGALHAEAKISVLPSQMLWILNDDLQARFRERMNCAMCIATIDVEDRILRYSNAGMPYPIVKRCERGFELESNGIPLGGIRTSEYKDVEIELQAGDLLVFFSDGISECPSRANSERLYMETNRLCSVINGFDSGMNALSMIDAILTDVRDFSGGSGQSDDITLVVVKVL